MLDLSYLGLRNLGSVFHNRSTPGLAEEAIRLAELRGKSELLMSNVTPWVKINKGEIFNVPETQEVVEKLLVKVCARLKRDVPEVRLTLRGSEFDIRCYLGREKPCIWLFSKQSRRFSDQHDHIRYDRRRRNLYLRGRSFTLGSEFL